MLDSIWVRSNQGKLRTPTIANHLAVHLHDVEAVEDNGGGGHALLYSGDISQAHIDGHRFNAVCTFLRKRIEKFEQVAASRPSFTGHPFLP